ncbi:OsmC family protein [Amycolatopsis rifamycinica]|uniref:Osmotically inducible protein C n=1 Tax=Amycolatopsis rifamycinica TaxID=287986 RepID=A0A066UEH8_9PSEU|nr:OsmC family protein [Amycolatopsis rifamycinica]KDN22608.1 osmotically inducible protein C [Amycolatopsis rifamycinica]
MSQPTQPQNAPEAAERRRTWVEDLSTTEATSSRGSVRVDGRGDLTYPVGEAGGDGTADPLNPERLYAAALATCLHQSLTIAATALDVEPGESVVTAKVTLAARGDGGYELRATVEMYLPGATTDSLYDAVTREALRLCPLVGEKIAVTFDRERGRTFAAR